MVLVYLSSAWLLGICLASLFQVPTKLIWLAAVLPAAVVILWWRERPIRLASACCLVLLLGALRFSASVSQFNEHSLAQYNGTGWTIIEGVVVAEPDVRATYTNPRLRADTLILEDESQRQVRGLALVRAARYPEYRYGDRLVMHGLLETPPEFADFSYKDYLARQGVYSLVHRPQITLLERGQGNPFWSALYAFKRRAQDTIARILPDPQAALLTGILLGVESSIPADLAVDYTVNAQLGSDLRME
jgi:competence protein ComEC